MRRQGDGKTSRVVAAFDVDGTVLALCEPGWNGPGFLVEQSSVPRRLLNRLRRLDAEAVVLSSWVNAPAMLAAIGYVWEGAARSRDQVTQVPSPRTVPLVENDIRVLLHDPSAGTPAQGPDARESEFVYRRMGRKLEAMQREIARDPRPFIWADDELKGFLTAAEGMQGIKNWADSTGVPYLIVSPASYEGLAPCDLAAMEAFCRKYRAWEASPNGVTDADRSITCSFVTDDELAGIERFRVEHPELVVLRDNRAGSTAGRVTFVPPMRDSAENGIASDLNLT